MSHEKMDTTALPKTDVGPSCGLFLSLDPVEVFLGELECYNENH